jgi:hypothetical protein
MLASTTTTRTALHIVPLTAALASRAASSMSTMHPQPQPKKEGDISSVFVSLSGTAAEPLPQRFAQLKRDLIAGREREIEASWRRLLKELKSENEIITAKGPGIVPSVNFNDVQNGSMPGEFVEEVKKRGVAVVRGVIPSPEARGYKIEVEDYVRANPHTKAFPPSKPAVFELYWSAAQLKARGHANLLKAQKALMGLWDTDASRGKGEGEGQREGGKVISTKHPLSYADRVRIRPPGDSGFALGPHIDGGSLERWEPEGYGSIASSPSSALKHISPYTSIFEGQWENYSPFDATSRLGVVSDLYNGAGACSMFRMFQGWLSMSETGPGEGTLKVYPAVGLSTAYFLLRPFFAPIAPQSSLRSEEEYLAEENWRLLRGEEVTSEIQGAYPGHAQELSEELHPHLELARTMVHIPRIAPGDYVVWHCDSIHAVDAVHNGSSDSSVLYIPVCPLTDSNAQYLARQREAFVNGTPGPDFPGGKGESDHAGRPTVDFDLGREGRQMFGLEKIEGEGQAVSRANEVLGFA